MYLRIPMKTRDQLLLFLSRNKELFRERFHIIKIGLFGSFARGEHTVMSDIDLIVEFEENTQDLYEIKIRLREFIKEETGRDVDICREKYIKRGVKEHILKEAIYVN